MSERNNDELANALRGLSDGDHGEPSAGGGQGTGQANFHEAGAAPSPITPAPTPAAARPTSTPLRPAPKPAPARPAPPSPNPAGASPVRTAPTGPSPMRPRAQPQPQPAPGARLAGRAEGPSPSAARPAAPVQPARPQDIVPPAGAFVDAGETTNVQPLDDDDVVIVPAAPLSSLGGGSRRRPGPSARVPLFKSLKFRRTAIPVLLTVGLLLLAVAGMRFVVHPDAVLATLSLGTCAALVAAAAVLLLIAGLNVVQVRRELLAEKPAPASGAA